MIQWQDGVLIGLPTFKDVRGSCGKEDNGVQGVIGIVGWIQDNQCM